MHCPKCGHLSDVIDSRVSETGSSQRRRRKCRSCGHRWSTLELDADVVRLTDKIQQVFLRAWPTNERHRNNNPSAPRIARSGYVVPAALEADWKVLKENGYRDDEAAKALGLEKGSAP